MLFSVQPIWTDFRPTSEVMKCFQNRQWQRLELLLVTSIYRMLVEFSFSFHKFGIRYQEMFTTPYTIKMKTGVLTDGS